MTSITKRQIYGAARTILRILLHDYRRHQDPTSNTMTGACLLLHWHCIVPAPDLSAGALAATLPEVCNSATPLTCIQEQNKEVRCHAGHTKTMERRKIGTVWPTPNSTPLVRNIHRVSRPRAGAGEDAELVAGEDEAALEARIQKAI